MAFEDTDRRRTLVLGLLTLIALPLIYLTTRFDSSADNGAGDTIEVVEGTASDTAGAGASANNGNEPNRPPDEAPDDGPVFMDGPAPNSDPGVAEVAVPARPEQPPMELTASYRSTVDQVSTCLVSDLGPGLDVTVTNLDNGRSIICTTAPAADNQIVDIVLQTETFSMLADLTEAPIPVEVVQ